MSDIESWVAASVKKSGVPLKVSDTAVLLSIASQLTGSMSKSRRDVSRPTSRFRGSRASSDRSSEGVESDISA